MSATAPAAATGRHAAARVAPELSLLLACGLGPALWLAADPPTLAARAAEPTALALGTDGTLLLAGLLQALGLPPVPALWGASWTALPVLAALPLRAGALRSVAVGAGLACHPMTLLACASGYGWAAVGFYGLWSAVLGLPSRSPHQGLVRLGLGVLAAMVCCPAPWTLFLPLFAVLFLAAPPALRTRDMNAVYLLAFVPVAAWSLTLLYAQWRSGAAGAGPLPGTQIDLPFLPAALLGLALCAAVAPGLARRARRAPAGAAALLASALLATGDAAPLALALLSASTAEAARAARAASDAADGGGGRLWGLALGMIAASLLSLAVG